MAANPKIATFNDIGIGNGQMAIHLASAFAPDSYRG
jgi:hypothetical protein